MGKKIVISTDLKLLRLSYLFLLITNQNIKVFEQMEPNGFIEAVYKILSEITNYMHYGQAEP